MLDVWSDIDLGDVFPITFTQLFIAEASDDAVMRPKSWLFRRFHATELNSMRSGLCHVSQTVCFGDIELKHGHTLHLTAMSDVRMQTLLDLLNELATAPLPPPQMSYDKVEMIDKVTGKRIRLRPSRTAR